jgi:hypothetical protein
MLVFQKQRLSFRVNICPEEKETPPLVYPPNIYVIHAFSILPFILPAKAPLILLLLHFDEIGSSSC